MNAPLPFRTTSHRVRCSLVMVVLTLTVAACSGDFAAKQARTPVAPVTVTHTAPRAATDNLPVYQLAPVTVTANRTVELAKMAEEDRLAQAVAGRTTAVVATPSKLD